MKETELVEAVAAIVDAQAMESVIDWMDKDSLVLGLFERRQERARAAALRIIRLVSANRERTR